MPVPRSPANDVRFALSNDPLNTMFKSGCVRRTRTSASATARHTPSFSSEHGPAMSRSFFGSKTIAYFFCARLDAGWLFSFGPSLANAPPFLFFIAAATNAAKSGCALFGFD